MQASCGHVYAQPSCGHFYVQLWRRVSKSMLMTLSRLSPSREGGLEVAPSNLSCISHLFLPPLRILALTFSRAPFLPRPLPARSRRVQPHRRLLRIRAGDRRGFAVTTYNQFLLLQHITNVCSYKISSIIFRKYDAEFSKKWSRKNW